MKEWVTIETGADVTEEVDGTSDHIESTGDLVSLPFISTEEYRRVQKSTEELEMVNIP